MLPVTNARLVEMSDQPRAHASCTPAGRESAPFARRGGGVSGRYRPSRGRRARALGVGQGVLRVSVLWVFRLTAAADVIRGDNRTPPVQRANALAQEGDDLGTPPDTDKTEFRPRAEGSRAPLSQMRHLPARPAAQEDDSRQLRESAATSSLNLQPLEPLIDSPSRWALVDSLYKGYIG